MFDVIKFLLRYTCDGRSSFETCKDLIAGNLSEF